MQVTNETGAATHQGLSIATMFTAGEVHRYMNRLYYCQLLNGLQTAAQRLGYYFGRAESAAAMPITLEYWLAWAVMYRDDSYKHPSQAKEEWEHSARYEMTVNGWGSVLLRNLLAALANIGIYLQETPDACSLLAAEEARQREDGCCVEPIPALLEPVASQSNYEARLGSVDIGTMPIADKVFQYVNGLYYSQLLNALQGEARRQGYVFDSHKDEAFSMSTVLENCLESAVVYRSIKYLTPGRVEARFRNEMGRARFSKRLLTALTQLDVHLQESPRIGNVEVGNRGISIDTIQMAGKVHERLQADVYLDLLAALQRGAQRLGYFFERAESATAITPILIDCLGWAVMHGKARDDLSEEDKQDFADRNMKTGYGQCFVRDMLAALADLGIYLQAGPQAATLLAAEEKRRQEKTSTLAKLSMLGYADSHARRLMQSALEGGIVLAHLLQNDAEFEETFEEIYRKIFQRAQAVATAEHVLLD